MECLDIYCKILISFFQMKYCTGPSNDIPIRISQNNISLATPSHCSMYGALQHFFKVNNCPNPFLLPAWISFHDGIKGIIKQEDDQNTHKGTPPVYYEDLQRLFHSNLCNSKPEVQVLAFVCLFRVNEVLN